jgi:hypothetical protein
VASVVDEDVLSVQDWRPWGTNFENVFDCKDVPGNTGVIIDALRGPARSARLTSGPLHAQPRRRYRRPPRTRARVSDATVAR